MLLALASSPGTSAASAQDPGSAIVVSMCSEDLVVGQCRDLAGDRIDTELTLLSPDGSEKRFLTDNDAYEHRPAWSPGHDRVVFSLGRRGWSCETNRGLRTMDADGTDVEVLTRRDFGCDFATDWSPDGRRILFERECSLCFEVWWISADGEHDQRLSTEGNRNDPDAYSLQGQWVKGGRAAVFAKSDYGQRAHGVFRVRRDATGLRRISPRMFVRDVVVSPNGRLIAFQGMAVQESLDRQPDVWVMRRDGSNLRQVTDDVTAERGLQWSPDDQRLVFVWGDQSDNHLVTVHKDGGDYTIVEPEGMSDELFRVWDPSWSPDGTEIAFLGERLEAGSGSRYAAYVVAADGSSYRRLTEFEEDLRVWGWEPVTQ